MIEAFDYLAKIFLNIIFLSFVFLSSVQAQSLSSEALLNEKGVTKTRITRIEVSGNSVFSDSEIEEIIAPFLDRLLDFNDLLQVTRRISSLYNDNGYTTSGAFLPQQNISDGAAKIEIIEGKLEKIEIEGRKNLQESFILSFFPNLDLPLNINNLREQLTLLQRDPAIEKVEGELFQGSSPESLVLVLEIEESPPFQITLFFNNYRSPSIGEYQWGIVSSYRNLIGIGDRFYGQYNITEGFDAYTIGWSLPVKVLDGIINFEYRQGDSQIIENPFRDAGIRIEVNTFSFKYRQAIFESTTREIGVSLGFDWQQEKTFLLESIPFPFEEGSQDGRSIISAINLEGHWVERGATSVLTVASQLRFGIDAFDATVNDDAPDGIFTLFRANIGWLKVLNEEGDSLLALRLTTQITPHSLLNSEKITIGGAQTVRGVRQNAGLGDNGVLGTAEVYIPLYRSRENQNRLNLIPFIDGGVVSNKDKDNVDSFMSVGVGLSFSFGNSGRIRLDYAVPIIDDDNSNDSLQESGLTFMLEFSPF